MQNMSHKAYIEVMSCVEDPRKDSGIILQPLEKLNFKAKDDEVLFARSAHIGGKHANLSVVNFNVPATNGPVAGGLESVVLFSGFVAGSKTVDPSILSLNDDMTKYDFIMIYSKYGWQPFTNVDQVKSFSLFTVSAYFNDKQNCFCNIVRLSNTTIG